MSTELIAIGTIPIPPHAGKVTDALSRIGYTIEEAIADLLDNCIDAHASKVLVRFVHDGAEIRRIIVADNGMGMDSEQLLSAMQFGSTRERTGKDLGKFGMGLKTAAFSQGRSLTVISRRGGAVAASRWTTQTIAAGWNCELLGTEEAAQWLDEIRFPFSIGKAGTMIVIESLDPLRTGSTGLEAFLQKLQKRLSVHLGLTFHRFLNDGFELYIDASRAGGAGAGFCVPVDGLDPFDYPISGDTNFPLDFTLKMAGLPSLKCQAHIWPANQSISGYVLSGGSVAKRQGFYFYRNNRLIQAGGWNGWRDNDSEPHLSLARISIDLPSGFDTEFRLNVQKSALDVPEAFRNGLNAAASPMKRFVRRAEEVYRKKMAIEQDEIPIPGRGFAADVRRRATNYLVGRKGPTQSINILWVDLDAKRFFEIDREPGNILLNSKYRQGVLGGHSARLNDAPVVKILIFLLLRDDLLRARESKQFVARLEQVNELLMLAISEEQNK